GFLGLVPTWFLLKLCIEKIPRTLLAAELVAAAMGPVSWLLVRSMAGGPPSNVPQAIGPMLGLFIAFIAIPRMVLGPVVMVIEAATFVLMRGRVVRVLLAAAILMD